MVFNYEIWLVVGSFVFLPGGGGGMMCCIFDVWHGAECAVGES